ncbi:MAG: DUF6361 family protein [Sphingomonas sp.]
MSFLGWLDHDPDHEQAVLQSLAAAKGQDARDELGLGTIRDTFSDCFFPGLSSVHQRLRYFLFVQWCCELATKGTDEADILRRLRTVEVDLIDKLADLGVGQHVIGIESREDLERMPSDIYWTGLRVLGLLREPGGRRRWARTVLERRHRMRDVPPVEGGAVPRADIGFDLSRPHMPPNFPQKGVTFQLERDERDFLRHRLSDACIDGPRQCHQYNLFGTFSGHRKETDVTRAWDHPRVEKLKPAAHDLLMLGRAFSTVMYGAVILYNFRVADLIVSNGGSVPARDRYVAELGKWRDALEPRDVALVRDQLPEIRRLGDFTRHRIGDGPMNFARGWARLCETPQRLLKDSRAGDFVCAREIALKEHLGTSRFKSEKALLRWQGDSGVQLDYRWWVARQYLNDLATAR